MPTCQRCAQRVAYLDLRDGICITCQVADSRAQAAAKAAEPETPVRDIPATTSLYLPGLDDHDVLGIVAGETVAGINALKELAVVVRDAVGGRSGTMEVALRVSRQSSLREMKAEAVELGADAVIGVQLTYGEAPSGRPGSMLLVVATGTAIKRKAPLIPTPAAS